MRLLSELGHVEPNAVTHQSNPREFLKILRSLFGSLPTILGNGEQITVDLIAQDSRLKLRHKILAKLLAIHVVTAGINLQPEVFGRCHVLILYFLVSGFKGYLSHSRCRIEELDPHFLCNPHTSMIMPKQVILHPMITIRQVPCK